MNGSRHVSALFSCCRKAVRPTLPLQNIVLSRCVAVESHRRPFSTGRFVNSNNDTFPKLPILQPMSFAMDLVQRSVHQVQWCTDEQNLDKDAVIETNEAAEKVLMFITECLVEENFKTLEEKFTPEALEQARSILASLPHEKRNSLIFKGTSATHFFSAESITFNPWSYSSKGHSLVLTYLALHAESGGQHMWIMTIDIPKNETTLSEDFQVSQFHFETMRYKDKSDK